MTPEWSHLERVDTIGEPPRPVTIAAGETERAALARRFGLIAIDRLDATFAVGREGGAIVATGRVTAAVTQACIASGEPVAATVDEPVSLRFVEDPGSDEELELSGDALDTLPIEHGAIDLGEAAAETMALALDPFPRSAAADAALAAAGVTGEDTAPADDRQTGAFAGLAALKQQLEK